MAKTQARQSSIRGAVRIQEDPAATAEAQAGAGILENNSQYLVELRQLLSIIQKSKPRFPAHSPSHRPP